MVGYFVYQLNCNPEINPVLLTNLQKLLPGLMDFLTAEHFQRLPTKP
jgi:hypothetical protein